LNANLLFLPPPPDGRPVNEVGILVREAVGTGQVLNAGVVGIIGSHDGLYYNIPNLGKCNLLRSSFVKKRDIYNVAYINDFEMVGESKILFL